jgi:S-adenosylmethionine:tRNA ribosyltransferase-isomerase
VEDAESFSFRKLKHSRSRLPQVFQAFHPSVMRLSEFDFPFDPTLVADHPIKPRDAARLLAVPRSRGNLSHHQVCNFPEFFSPGDVLVVNNTKVIPARLWGKKVPTEGKVEVLVVRPIGEGFWEVLIKGKVSPGQSVEIDKQSHMTVIERSAERTLIRLEGPISMQDLLAQKGEIPLPPYIRRRPTSEDLVDYQTVFAREEGAVAAPTAGLHFSSQLIKALECKGVQVVSVTLHVGPGTFRPVVTENIQEHRMDAEWFAVSPSAAESINRAKSKGGRIVAVGTTVMRTLESVANREGNVLPQIGETQLFITPGFRFQVVDNLMTNFHFPRTTLLMLVSAFAGIEQARTAYAEAVQERYRMYSYGDAMLIY